MQSTRPTAFRVAVQDNVATLLVDAQPGIIEVLGEGQPAEITLIGPVKRGHKVALTHLAVGDPITKYGIVIGRAAQPIEPGQHVHLHNCHSAVDSRSSTLALDDGTPTDTPYE